MNIQRIKELISRVPRPPEEGIPEGITDAELNSFEERTGIALPEDVREWLKVANGPCVGPGGLFGLGEIHKHFNIYSFLEMYPCWKKKKWIPIGGDGCGNYYVVATQREYGEGFPVLFVDTLVSPELPSYIAASDIGHFLIFLLERELGNMAWPFNEKVVTTNDPGILHFTGIPLPWEAK
jgi:hypothetical protein